VPSLVLIVGGDSQLGRSFAKFLSAKGKKFHATTRRKALVASDRPFLDLCKIDRLEFPHHYDVVVHFAGVTKLEECKKKPQETRKVNVDGVFAVSKYFSLMGAYQIFCSSDRAGDLPDQPVSERQMRNMPTEYGRQKAEAENNLSTLKGICVCRIPKVLGPDSKLITDWKRELLAGRAIYAYGDVFLSPVTFGEVNSFLFCLVGNKSTGVVSIKNSGRISYFELARQLSAELQCDPDQVRLSTSTR
jgi:dTDP-4-dehydrorhamnose reductase